MTDLSWTEYYARARARAEGYINAALAGRCAGTLEERVLSVLEQEKAANATFADQQT